MFDGYAAQYPELAAELKRRLAGDLPENWSDTVMDALCAAEEAAEDAAEELAEEASDEGTRSTFFSQPGRQPPRLAFPVGAQPVRVSQAAVRPV